MSKHTPGPWRFIEASQTIVSNQSHPIARLTDPFHRQLHNGKTGADGPLIAAAPNLRDALFRICDAETLAEARHIADEALAALGGDE